MIVDIFDAELKRGIENCPKGKNYVVVHVFSGHMSVYCEYYDDLESIAKGIAHGINDPQGAVEVKAIYDMTDHTLVYCDLVGMVDTIHSAWENLSRFRVR